jgi:hypothetical protein
MHIKIAERLRIFSHRPGTYCLLPGTALRLQIFPALIRIEDLSNHPPKPVTELKLNIEGPVEDFTVLLDLEKGYVKVWGHGSNGFFRYKIVATQDSNLWALSVEKGQVSELVSSKFSDSKALYIPPLTDRLSLGNHKSQDWDMVIRRQNLEEIFPAWLRLGQLLPKQTSSSFEGTAHFLELCQKAKENKDRLPLLQPFLYLFMTGFQNLLSPRLTDEQHQGFDMPSVNPKSSLSPLVLLTEGAKIIRSLFVEETAQGIAILPALPIQFHHGRFIQVKCQGGRIDLEWTKKSIRRLIFYAEETSSLKFLFSKEIRQFRFRKGDGDRGCFLTSQSAIEVEKEKIYYLDNFQK